MNYNINIDEVVNNDKIIIQKKIIIVQIVIEKDIHLKIVMNQLYQMEL